MTLIIITVFMLHICTSNSNREKDDIEGFGWRWDSRDTHSSALADADAGLPSNGGRGSASFKPLSGLLCANNKYIPLMYAPLTFEFEIVSSATEAVVSAGTTVFTSSNTSNVWQIEDVRMIADIVTLDNELQNSYTTCLRR